MKKNSKRQLLQLNGLAPNDAEGMANAMLEICAMDRETLQGMGAACRSYIVNELNRKQTTLTCFDVMVQLVEERK